MDIAHPEVSWLAGAGSGIPRAAKGAEVIQQLDAQRAQAFARKMVGIYTGGMLMLLIDIGYRTGLFEEATRTYTLPPEHAALLTGESARNLAPMSQLVGHFGKQVPAEPGFDLITAFDAIHDQVNPAVVLRRVREALAPDGIFFMVDFKGSSNLEENLDYPFATLCYGISLMHCMTVSPAESGAGLGSMWGEQLARHTLAEAGFAQVEVFDSPRPQNCIYVCRL